jgi:hypothetical protein
MKILRRKYKTCFYQQCIIIFASWLVGDAIIIDTVSSMSRFSFGLNVFFDLIAIICILQLFEFVNGYYAGKIIKAHKLYMDDPVKGTLLNLTLTDIESKSINPIEAWRWEKQHDISS